MQIDLSGLTALITGGSRGIGRAIASPAMEKQRWGRIINVLSTAARTPSVPACRRP